MRGGHGVQRQGDGIGSVAVVVDGVNGHRPVAVGAVDDPQESLLGGTFRFDQGEAVLVLCEGTRRLHQQERECQAWADRNAVPEPGFLVGRTPGQCPGEQ